MTEGAPGRSHRGDTEGIIEAESLAPLILQHNSDSDPGIRRQGTTRFRYVNVNGKPVRDEATLARITALAIPPAWTNVWISPLPNGYLQATGRDAKGRKQSRYHASYRAERDEEKFSLLVPFGDSLSRLRSQVARDMAERVPSLNRQTALVVHLLDVTAIRVGNEAYVRRNNTYGLSTLRTRQAQVHGAEITFSFVGKSGKAHRVTTYDRRVARLVRQCHELPGQRLFTYIDDDGRPKNVESTDVNAYLRRWTGGDFTAKTFRTWTATTQVAAELGPLPGAPTKSAFLSAVDRAAQLLGNTRTVCRTSYIHPLVESSFYEGSLRVAWSTGPRRPTAGLTVDERRTLHLLRTVGPGDNPLA